MFLQVLQSALFMDKSWANDACVHVHTRQRKLIVRELRAGPMAEHDLLVRLKFYTWWSFRRPMLTVHGIRRDRGPRICPCHAQ
jgi:hypothetical protein